MSTLLVVLATFVGLVLSPTPARSADPGSCGQWEMVPSPNQGQINWLYGVAGVARKDAWAVGFFVDDEGEDHALAQHWDGAAWSTFQTPPVEEAYLQDVTAATSIDVWAVGRSESDGDVLTLIEHWDGDAWTVVGSPNAEGNHSSLFSTDAIDAGDIWAVGHSGPFEANRTLILHWNGSRWRIVPSPNAGESSWLVRVSAVAADDVWAVGTYRDGSVYKTLTQHWDGRAWTIVPSPNVSDVEDSFFGLAAISANDVWAVGRRQGDRGKYRTLTQHWNGSEWSVVPSPNASQYNNHPEQVVALSSTEVWSMGRYLSEPFPRPVYLTMAQNWDGSTWRLQPSPNVDDARNLFLGAATVGTLGDIWAVGYAGPTTQARTITAHYCSP